MPATKRAAKPAAQNRSRMQSPKRGTTSVKKASDRSRLQAPKSAASQARSKAARPATPWYRTPGMGGSGRPTWEEAKGRPRRPRPVRPSPMRPARQRR